MKMTLLFCGGIPLAATVILWMIGRLDGEAEPGLQHIPAWLWILTAACGCLAGTGILCRIPDGAWGYRGTFAVGAVYLLVCGVTDFLTFQVYDFMQFAGVAAGVWSVLCQPIYPRLGVSLILFALLQYVLFMRLYGQGDVMIFLVCALFETARGGDIQTYLLHMAASCLLLGIVQLAKHNIGTTGNLKKSVPLVPYIAITAPVFWLG